MNEKVYNETRKIIIETKMGVIWVCKNELFPFLNMTAIAKHYFDHSQSWFSQRVHSCTVRNHKVAFKAEEYAVLSSAYRDLAKKLIQAADELDAAKDE